MDTILRDHVTLKLECVDRLYLNGYRIIDHAKLAA